MRIANVEIVLEVKPKPRLSQGRDLTEDSVLCFFNDIMVFVLTLGTRGESNGFACYNEAGTLCSQYS